MFKKKNLYIAKERFSTSFSMQESVNLSNKNLKKLYLLKLKTTTKKCSSLCERSTVKVELQKKSHSVLNVNKIIPYKKMVDKYIKKINKKNLVLLLPVPQSDTSIEHIISS